MDRTAQLSQFGLLRLSLLDCLGGNSPDAAGYFNPAAGTDIFAAFGQHVAHMCLVWGAETDRMTPAGSRAISDRRFGCRHGNS